MQPEGSARATRRLEPPVSAAHILPQPMQHPAATVVARGLTSQAGKMPGSFGQDVAHRQLRLLQEDTNYQPRLGEKQFDTRHK